MKRLRTMIRWGSDALTVALITSALFLVWLVKPSWLRELSDDPSDSAPQHTI